MIPKYWQKNPKKLHQKLIPTTWDQIEVKSVATATFTASIAAATAAVATATVFLNINKLYQIFFFFAEVRVKRIYTHTK